MSSSKRGTDGIPIVPRDFISTVDVDSSPTKSQNFILFRDDEMPESCFVHLLLQSLNHRTNQCILDHFFGIYSAVNLVDGGFRVIPKVLEQHPPPF